MGKISEGPDTQCCLLLPYHVTVYRDGYVSEKEKPQRYMTDSGRLSLELTTKQIAILEQGKHHPQYETMRVLIKEAAQKVLTHDITLSIEDHEGIGCCNTWILPFPTSVYPSFIVLTGVESVLRGTHREWKKRKAGIYFTAKVLFCVSLDR